MCSINLQERQRQREDKVSFSVISSGINAAFSSLAQKSLTYRTVGPVQSPLPPPPIRPLDTGSSDRGRASSSSSRLPASMSLPIQLWSTRELAAAWTLLKGGNCASSCLEGLNERCRCALCYGMHAVLSDLTRLSSYIWSSKSIRFLAHFLSEIH